MEYGVLVSIPLLLQGLVEMLQGDSGAVRPQVGGQVTLCHPNVLIHQVEQLIFQSGARINGRRLKSLCIDIPMMYGYNISLESLQLYLDYHH